MALATYQYNYVHAVSQKWVLGKWVFAEALRDELRKLPEKGSDSWGDVYARLA